MNDSDSFDPLIDRPPSRYVVGIDLGTTNSAVTYVDTEESPWRIRVLLIPQRVSANEMESLDTLPSFHFTPVEVGQTESVQASTAGSNKKSAANSSAKSTSKDASFVGAFARDESTRTSGRGIASAKSWLSHSAVDRTAALLPWHAAENIERRSPVEVSAAFLRHIRGAWDQQFAGYPLAEQDIVITLPASFDEVARELTVSAAAAAGLPKIVLIEEPQAAFYAWVYKHDANWSSLVAVGQTILVCDIGGGTSDFTLIRVRQSGRQSGTGSDNGSAHEGPTENSIEDTSTGQVTEASKKIQFHRIAVGNHLILGGDNLDLAIAKYVEQKLSGDSKLAPHQWEVLVGRSREVKEQLLSADGPDRLTIHLPGRGSSVLGGGVQTEVLRQEIQDLILSGFLPVVDLHDKPETHGSGFQEFGLPFASDPAITRYLADFLTTHLGSSESCHDSVAKCKPDIVLFNGGFFASPILRNRVIDQISRWFANGESDSAVSDTGIDSAWRPQILDNDRLDLAVARGAAYYGMVRRDQGVRMAASLARSYYIGVAVPKVEGSARLSDDASLSNDVSDASDEMMAVCIMPGSAEAGESFTLSDRPFRLAVSQPVEFSLFVSSVRLSDQPGQMFSLDPEQMKSLPPIRTVLKTKSRNEKRAVAVELVTGLTEIGTLDLAFREVDSDRSWKLQFDVRSTTQTDIREHLASGESQGFVDEETWLACESCLASVFDESGNGDPQQLVNSLSAATGLHRDEWPMSLLRRIWDGLIQRNAGRTKSANHEARWLNLLGYSLRPGYGVALDDWRVTETWRSVNGKLNHATPSIRNESLILWRRVAGGLTAGQQSALAGPLLAGLRALAKQMEGKSIKGSIPIRPEESMEVSRLLGSLELLSLHQKAELGNLIFSLIAKPKLAKARDAMIWALGRLGQRTPLYGPLNTVLPTAQVESWIRAWLKASAMTVGDPIEQLAIVQMSRRTHDRYRDIDAGFRGEVLKYLQRNSAAEHLLTLVRDGGQFDAEEQSRVFGESLPQGLRL